MALSHGQFAHGKLGADVPGRRGAFRAEDAVSLGMVPIRWPKSLKTGGAQVFEKSGREW
jgi:hypothetical protein